MSDLREAIVTGVSRGIGEAIAHTLLARGWRVTGIGRAASARLTGERFALLPCDLADVARLAAVLAAPFAAIAARAPAQVCLVNNAAVARPTGVFGRLDPTDIAAAVAVNVAAPAALASLFVRAFADVPGDRRIVNVSSGAAGRPIAGLIVYCASKCALEMVTAGLAVEQGAHGIRAVTLRPGIVATDMQVDARSQPLEAFPSGQMFRDFHAQGLLVEPDSAAARIVTYVIEGPVEQGRTYDYASLGAVPR